MIFKRHLFSTWVQFSICTYMEVQCTTTKVLYWSPPYIIMEISLPRPKKGWFQAAQHTCLPFQSFDKRFLIELRHPSAHFSTQLICQRVSSLSKVIAMISLKTFLTWISDGIDTICTWHDFHFSVCNMLSSIYFSGNEIAMQRYDYSSGLKTASHWKGIFIGVSHS